MILQLFHFAVNYLPAGTAHTVLTARKESTKSSNVLKRLASGCSPTSWTSVAYLRTIDYRQLMAIVWKRRACSTGTAPAGLAHWPTPRCLHSDKDGICACNAIKSSFEPFAGRRVLDARTAGKRANMEALAIAECK